MTHSRTDMLAGLDLGRAKRLLPEPVKDVATGALRLGGTLTAAQRPGPDFLVVGTKRGGTTSLWHSLLAHPQVMPMVPAAKNLKSPAYFHAHHHRGEAWYRGHFPTRRARAAHAARFGAAVAGEASPMYLWDPRVAARAARTVPDARIVVLLRDPVARAWSHYRERCKQGAERLSFPAALSAEDGRLSGELERMWRDPRYYSRAWDWYSYRSRGEYAASLAQWFDAFPREQVLVLRSEEFYTDQRAVLTRVHAHLGLDAVSILPTRLNGAPTGVPLNDDVAHNLRSHYVGHNAALSELLGASTWWSTSTRSEEQSQ